MDGKEDWLWRPVLAGILKAESLLDDNMSLEFIALCNEALDVKAENENRARKAVEDGQ